MVGPEADPVSYGALIRALASDGVTMKETQVTIVREPAKIVLKLKSLRRTDGAGRQLRRNIEIRDMDEIVPPTEIRSICAQLEVDPARFGFRWADGHPHLAVVPDEPGGDK